MKFHTQTSLEPGNCFQTAVACLLDVEPEEVPDQLVNDAKRVTHPDGSATWEGPHYVTALNAYLRTHHGLAYMEVHYPIELFTHAVQLREPGYHLMTGRTVRSPVNNSRHVVVGRFGELVWDPHPSRAGLIEDVNYAFLLPFPQSWKKIPGTETPCVCPKCAG